MSARAAFLRAAFRVYPFQKGRYRLMMLFEKALERRGTVQAPYCGRRLFLDLASPGLERTFFHFMPERYEHETQEYIRLTVRNGMTAMDIGAHHGLFTVLLAECAGDAGKVYSFEPEKENFAKLERNITLNGLRQAEALPVALSDFSGRTRLVLSGSDTGHKLRDAAIRPGGEEQEVGVETLDAFIEERAITRVDLVKIDAESSEHLILKGARKSLEAGILPRVICEVHASRHTNEVGGDKVRRIFYSNGYKSFVLNSKLAGQPFLSELSPEKSLNGLQNVLFIKAV